MAEESHSDIDFVEYIVKAIVDSPDKVKLDRSVDEMGVLIELTVDPSDMGKVIGKEGQNAQALRTLLRVLGAKQNSRVNLKILEPEGGDQGHSSRREEAPVEDEPEAEPMEKPADLGDDVPTDVLV